MKHLALLVCAAAALSTAGCKKKSHYSSNCSSSVALAAPWNAMKLPTGEAYRVCRSNDLNTQFEYLEGDGAGWSTQFDTALVGLGFAKERCSGSSCTYLKAGEKVNVRVNQVATGKKAKTIVELTRTPAKGPAQ